MHKSTISRELKRNKGVKGYYAREAHDMSVSRKKIAKKAKKMTSYLKFCISQKIEQDWSPEQIAGYFRKHDIAHISHQTIYAFIEQDKQRGGKLFKKLRHASKTHRKRYGSTDSRGQIKNKTMIDERPKIVDEKSRIGDWEIDTIIGKNHKGVIVTAVERKSKYAIAYPVENKSAKCVSNALIGMLKPFKSKVLTITGDNGKEFAQHEKIAKKLKALFFFAHPYSSWERGLNENTNGLLRQYYPKKHDLKNVDLQDLDAILEKVNSRPRKTLNYATPKEVFFGLNERSELQCEKVALVT